MVDAQAWAEERLGPTPKKPTWAELEQTFRTGPRPMKARRGAADSAAIGDDQLEQRLMRRLELLEQRVRRKGTCVAEILQQIHLVLTKANQMVATNPRNLYCSGTVAPGADSRVEERGALRPTKRSLSTDAICCGNAA